MSSAMYEQNKLGVPPVRGKHEENPRSALKLTQGPTKKESGKM